MADATTGKPRMASEDIDMGRTLPAEPVAPGTLEPSLLAERAVLPIDAAGKARWTITLC